MAMAQIGTLGHSDRLGGQLTTVRYRPHGRPLDSSREAAEADFGVLRHYARCLQVSKSAHEIAVFEYGTVDGFLKRVEAGRVHAVLLIQA